MGEIKGFMKYKRQPTGYRPVEERIHDFKELELPLTPEQIQAALKMHIEPKGLVIVTAGDFEAKTPGAVTQ